MNIGLLKERKRDERRVALRPDQVQELVSSGHEVWVESGAGDHVGNTDEAYRQVGARVGDQAEVYQEATLLPKVKCPLPEEIGFLKPEHVLFTYLHFDENITGPRIRQIVDTGVTGVAYEWVEVDGRFPLLQPMSELTGAVFARKSMSLLMEHSGALGGEYLDAWPPARVMIIGAGHIGANAINVLAANRYRLVVVDKHPETLADRVCRYVDRGLWEQAGAQIVRFDESKPRESRMTMLEHLPDTDIVICAAVRRSTFPKKACEFLITRQDVARMRPNSIVCDATACDRDLMETCISSESLTETYVEEGVIHYNCDHIPSLVARTATAVLTAATFDFVKLLCNGFEQAVQQSCALAKGVMCYRGKLTHEYSARKKQMDYTDLAALL